MNEMKTLTIDGKSYEVVDAEARSMIENAAGLSMELVWENSNPNAEFAAQTINLELAECEAILVEFRLGADGPYSTAMGVRKNATIGAYGISYWWPESSIRHREFSFYNDRVSFGVGYYFTTTWTQYNSGMIPTRIYGIKGVSE